MYMYIFDTRVLICTCTCSYTGICMHICMCTLMYMKYSTTGCISQGSLFQSAPLLQCTHSKSTNFVLTFALITFLLLPHNLISSIMVLSLIVLSLSLSFLVRSTALFHHHSSRTDTKAFSDLSCTCPSSSRALPLQCRHEARQHCPSGLLQEGLPPAGILPD